mmetsp:Transcript_89603/g.159068  ORF Transcript_89603/g.159068 Transcript_89603/m.159068 type:complete len:350 (-) Transcript_89603:61-1110(-)
MSEIAINPSQFACKYCKDPFDKNGLPKVRIDTSMGTVVCTGCGTVMEDRCFDEGREWRNFAPEGVDSQVTSRERGDFSTAIDERTGEIGGTTILGAGSTAQKMQQLGRKAQTSNAPELTAQQKKEKMVMQCTAKATDVCRRLNLGQEVVNCCIRLLQDLSGKDKLQGRFQATWFCALVHIATSEEKVLRTIQDIAEANASALGKKKGELEQVIAKRTKDLCDALERNQPAPMNDPELMKRYVEKMGFPQEFAAPARRMVELAYKLEKIKPPVEKSQIQYMAAAIFIVAYLYDVEPKPRIEDLAVVVNATEVGVQMAYNAMREKIKYLVPENFVVRYKLGTPGLPAATTK